jgi:hypothetical protein
MAQAATIRKESSDVSRLTIDLTIAGTVLPTLNPGEGANYQWLNTETVVGFQTPTVKAGPGIWASQPFPQIPLPPDPSPVTVSSFKVVNSNTAVQFFIANGTAGYTYTVAVILQDTVGRFVTLEITVNLAGTVPVPATPVAAPVPPGALPLLGGTMLGPLYAFESPLTGTEVATKAYVDNTIANGFSTVNISASGTVTTATLAVTGNSTFTGTSTFIGAVTAGTVNVTSLVLGGAASISGGTISNSAVAATTLSASNTVTLSPANHSVTISPSGTGQTIIGSGVAGNMDNVAIGQITPLAGKFTTLAVTGAATVGTTLGVTGALTAGNTTITGTLGVTGVLTTTTNAIINGTLTAAGAATVGGTLGVTGVFSTTVGATIGGTLGVSGILTTTTNTVVGGTLTVSGQTTIHGLTTSGATSLAGGQTAITGAASTGGTNALFVQNLAGTQGLIVTNGALVLMPQTFNNTTGTAANMVIDAAGILYISTSSRRYKKRIQAYPDPLGAVGKLRAVRYKSKIKTDGDGWFAGLVAEEVHDAGLTEFVTYDADGKPNGVQYGTLAALGVGAINELARRVAKLEKRHV